MEMTPDLFNGVFGSIHARLAAREDLEADFEALIAQGTSAALTMVQENVAPQLAALVADIEAAQEAIDALLEGQAADSLKLGGQVPGYYLDPANFVVSADIKTFLGAADAAGARAALGIAAVVTAAIEALIASAPGTLDTLDELASALGNDPDFAATMATALAARLQRANNLSDLANPSTALTNLGLSANAKSFVTAANYAAMFGLLKQPATATATGVVERATTAEAIAGIDDERFITPAGAAASLLTASLGLGQTWQNVAASRTHTTSYQNTTGKPIVVSITNTSTFRDFEVSTDNITWLKVQAIGGGASRSPTVIVPPSHYYRVNGSTAFDSWTELR